ncbi:ERCC4 domain containing protein [Nitzschia inconspicua]|uniref:ERCC4 domain containing protein n=1 Tax=Nitzschia inconspicua TaxID=303405 RepID=A0A9K3LVS8_9STRA|nr:ERCC4 domain containing protein [Nitzschia inconspicua]
MLSSWGTPHEMMPTVITNESGQASARQEMYSRGGVLCITSRILIVDLLTKTLSSKDVDGMLVGHADQVTHDSTEAFIIRIYTSQKRRDQCFIKAFTDAPDALLSGFAKVEKTLKALQVRNLYLYPRFHDSIKRELEQNPPQVEELHQKLSPSMMDIQAAMVVAVQSCMKELKQSTPFVEWNHTSSDLNIENCVTTAFDRAISRQLEKDWHRLQPKTKQLVQDLRLLRTLLEALIQYDCVSFWKLLQSIKTMSAASRHPAMWLLTPAADMIFKKAKERIYKIQTKEPTPKVPKPVVKLLPVLEENPKWRLLKNVLLEIKQQTEQQQQQERQLQEEEESQVTILVVVKDDRTVDIVRSYLVEGRDRTMTLRWLRYLEQYNDRSPSVADCKISEESRLLLEEESRVRRILFGNLRHENNEVNKNHDMKKRADTAASLNTVPVHVRKRRRIATEKGRGANVGATAEDRERQAVLEDAIEAAEHDMMETTSRTGNPDTGMDIAPDDQEYDDEEDEMFHTMFQVTMPQEPNIVIKSLASMDGTTAGMFLSDLRPNYVVLYDFDVGFVRSLEVHAALTVNGVNAKSKKSAALKVYFMMFEASAEEKVFLKALQREKNAFERLIHHKKTMPPPVLRVEGTQEMQQALARGDGVAGTFQGGSLPLSMDTRTGGGQAKDVARNIAVDVREFRSALPSILHQGGMRLAPVTLTVGDFVLSNVHCVERKSISDLFGSFASGRLYTQAEQMSKYYTRPCLLIEFDPQKTFCLQNAHELGMDIKTDSICSKLAILTMHFPKLSVLWSKSPYETLRLFKELKASRGEVDVAKAVEIGRNDSVEALLSSENGGEVGDDDDDDDINEAGRDMLLSLPGMTVQIARRVMEKCDCLADLMVMSRDELRSLVGPVAGQKVFTFFHQQLGSL